MLGNHFLPPWSLFLPFCHWKIEQWPKKRKYGEPFAVLSYKRRPMHTLIRGKSLRLPTQLSSDFLCRAMQLDTPTRAFILVSQFL